MISPEQRRQNANENQWLHDELAVKENPSEYLSIVRDQCRFVVRGEVPPCAVCGFQYDQVNTATQTSGWMNVFRCFKCGLWLCKICAKPHFEVRPN